MCHDYNATRYTCQLCRADSGNYQEPAALQVIGRTGACTNAWRALHVADEICFQLARQACVMAGSSAASRNEKLVGKTGLAAGWQ
jgi:hypothetical protein